MIQTPASPHFVGRRAELDQLRSALARAIDGHPQAVLVAGEAGVGKSRLISHFLTRPACTGLWRMTGVCVDVSGESLPFGPIRDAMRSFRRSITDRERRHLEQTSAAGRMLLLEPTEGKIGEAGPGARQAITFESFLDVMVEAAAIRPLLIVIEDLHWADSSSLACLNFLLAHLLSERVLVLGTYRSDELHRTHRLRPWVAEQVRKDPVHLVDLPRLNRTETEEVIQAVTGNRPAAGLASSIYQRSEGNAFFVEELSRALPAERGALPTSVREVLLARLRTPSEEVQRLLRVAAVGGRTIDPEALSEVTAMGHDRLFKLLRVAVADNVLVVGDGGDGFGFRHALLHEVALSEVLPGERERLHLAFAEVLHKRLEGAPDRAQLLGRIAHHLWAARDADKALAFSVQAGNAAFDVGAFDTAFEHFERALSLWTSANVPLAPELDRAALLERTAAAAHFAGDDDRAIAFMTAAIDELDDTDDPVRLGLLYEQLGWYHFMGGPRAEAFPAYERALKLVPEVPPSAERARILAAYSRLQMLFYRYDDAIRTAEEALSAAATIGARHEECMALNPLGAAVSARGEPERGLEILRRSLGIAAELEDHYEEAMIRINIGELLRQLGRSKEAVQMWLEGYERAYKAGLRRRIGGFFLCNVAEIQYASGDWEAMNTTLEEADPWMAPGFNRGFWLTLMGRLKMGLGDFARARECLEWVAVREPDSLPMVAVDAMVHLAELELWEEHFEDAGTNVAEALSFMDRGFENEEIAHLVLLGLRIEADRAAAPGASDSVRQDALRRAESLVETASHKGWDVFSPPAEARTQVAAVSEAAAVGCRAELTRLKGTPESSLWADSAARWSVCGRPFYEAYARFRQGEALASMGRRLEAEVAVRRAFTLADTLGAKPLLHEINMLARRARLDLQPEGRKAAPSSATEPRPDLGLTEREIEVLKHVGMGRTNAEIAALLFISPKTASVHVSNIMRKLGVSNRVAAARAAHKAGLTDAGTPDST